MRLRKVPQSKTVSVSVGSFVGGMNGMLDENVLPPKSAREVVNLDCHNGALVSGIGVKSVCGEDENNDLAARLFELSAPKKLYHFRRVDGNGERADFLIALDGGNLVAIDLFCPQNSNQIIWSGLAEEPNCVNYNLNGTDVIIFSFGSGTMIVWDGENSAYSVADAPAISSMALHYERLFATGQNAEQNTVWFSDDLDPTNWSLSLDEAGFIQMADERGASLRVVSFLDYVYVFREYGISRISGYGDQTQFLVSQLSCQTGKIFPDTVTLVGDRILFLAEDGMFSFNGLSATKILPSLNDYFVGADNTNAVAVAGEGKWFLLCNMMLENNLQQKTQTQVVLEYSIAENKVILGKGTGIVSLCSLRLPLGSRVFAIVDKSKTSVVQNGSISPIGSGFLVGEVDHSGTVFGLSLVGEWKSPWTDIGFSDAVKILRKVSLCTNGKKVELRLATDRGSTELEFGCGGKKVETKLVALRGDKLRFVLLGESKDFYASNLKLVLSIARQ